MTEPKSDNGGAGGARPRTLLVGGAVGALLALLVGVACNATPGAGGDGTNPNGTGAGCAVGVGGCACDTPGVTLECGKQTAKSGDYVTCSMGHSTCTNGTWTPCTGDRIVTKSLGSLDLAAGGGLHTLTTTSACSNACDPNPCTQTVAGPTDIDATGFGPQDGGIGLVLGEGGAAACSGLQCAVASCGGLPDKTTITGFVYDPGTHNPLYNVTVFVPVDPTGTLPSFTAGASTLACGGAGSITAVTSTTTDSSGAFTLKGVPSGTGLPAGTGIPLVFQLGKWRREIVLSNINSCVNNVVNAGSCIAAMGAGTCDMRLPKNRADGFDWVTRTYARADMPKLAFVSGSADPFECLLLKIGIDVNEFGSTTLRPNQAIDYYESPFSPSLVMDGVLGNRVKGDVLWNAAVSYMANYDAIILPCEGGEHDKKTTGVNPYANMITYANNGGHIFATHFSYDWLKFPISKGYVAGPDNWPVATWVGNHNTQDPMTASVVTSFPRGQAFANWLLNVGASPSYKTMIIHQGRQNLTNIGASTQAWMKASDDNSGGDLPDYTPHFTIDTPYTKPTTFGRAVYSDFHVSGDDVAAPAVRGAPPCLLDTDCGFGQTCSGGAPRAPGKCQEDCGDSGDCPNTSYACSSGGGTCKMKSCQDDPDCPPGAQCNNNKCECVANGQCGSGTCLGTKTCTAKACALQSDCGGAEKCQGSGGAGTCSKGCTTSAQCGGGEICMNLLNTTTASFVQPAVAGTVTITVASNAGMALGQILYVAGGGKYTITAIAGTSVTINNTTAQNAAPGAVIPATSAVTAECGGGAGCTCSGCFTDSMCASKSNAQCNGAAGTTGSCTPVPAPKPPGTQGLFPSYCKQGAMTSQEQALEFMFFDLTSCVDTASIVPPPPKYTAAIFTEDFTATCPPDARVAWRELDYQSVIVGDSSIEFSVQSGPTVTSLLPATPVPLTTSTTSTVGVPANFDVAFIDTSNGKGGPGTGAFNTAVPRVLSDKVLRLTVKMNPTSDGFKTPLLLQWKVQADCVPAE